MSVQRLPRVGASSGHRQGGAPGDFAAQPDAGGFDSLTALPCTGRERRVLERLGVLEVLLQLSVGSLKLFPGSLDAIPFARGDGQLGELRAREAATRAVVDQRAAAQKPIVGTQLGYQRTNHVNEFGLGTGALFRVIFPDIPDNYRARIDLQWPVYTGGRLEALERAARAELESSGHELATVRADLKLEVTRAFWALLTARETAHVLEEALRRMDAQLADVRARFDAGFVPPNDVLSVEAQRARQVRQLRRRAARLRAQ